MAVAGEPGQPIVSVRSIDELYPRFGTRGVGSRLPLQLDLALLDFAVAGDGGALFECRARD